MVDRRNLILAGLQLDGLGLEIGGGYNPIASRDDFRVEHLDRADRAGLIEKYAAEGIDTSRIQHVDYVWSGQAYAELVGEKRYDWIIASHVIEHVPNPIGFLNDCAAILADGGVLSLVIPDKRSCFDYYRPTTGLARFVDAFVLGDTRTTAGAVVEHLMYAATVDGAITWNEQSEHATPQFLHTSEQARDAFDSVVRDHVYHDVHAWVFTPYSFRMIAEDLYRLGLTTLRELAWHDTEGIEFFIQLSRSGAGPDVTRDTLALEALTFPRAESMTAKTPFAPLAATARCRDGEELVALARSGPRKELIVQSTSGHPEICLIRDGRRHPISSPEWIAQHGYSSDDLLVVDDDVIKEVTVGEVLTA